MFDEKRNFYLITELHKFLSDDDYQKIEGFLTVYNTDGNININTASSEVLQSLGLSAADADSIVESAKQEPYDPVKKPITNARGMTTMISGHWSCQATCSKSARSLQWAVTRNKLMPS
jgi:type II secretory pathway component PulK